MIGRRAALLSFVASAMLAGGNGVGIRFSNRELPPLWGAGVRFAVAGVLLLIVMAVMRLPLPRGSGHNEGDQPSSPRDARPSATHHAGNLPRSDRHNEGDQPSSPRDARPSATQYAGNLLGAWAGPFTYGLLNFAASYALGYYALLHMRAGFGQILLALVPLTTLLLAVAERQEKLKLTAVIGTLLALAGVVLMAWVPQAEPVPLPAIVAAVASTLCLGQTAVLVHRLPSAHPVTTNAIGMTIGALVLLASSFLAGEAHPLPQRTETWVALVYLVLCGSIGVFVLYLLVLRSWPASRAAYIFVLIPLVTVALSAWLDGERFGPGVVLGGLLVLVGVYFGALRRPPGNSTLDPEGGILPVDRG